MSACPLVMAAILFSPHEKTPNDPYPRLTLLVVGLFVLGWLCTSVVLLIRPPRVEIDEWGFRAFDPFRGAQARSWDDCGEFRVRRRSSRGAVYMAGPGFNAELPVWKSWNLQLPIVIGARTGMCGPKFADLLNQYRNAFATQRPEPIDGAERGRAPHGGEGPEDWLSLEPPSPDM